MLFTTIRNFVFIHYLYSEVVSIAAEIISRKQRGIFYLTQNIFYTHFLSEFVTK